MMTPPMPPQALRCPLLEDWTDAGLADGMRKLEDDIDSLRAEGFQVAVAPALRPPGMVYWKRCPHVCRSWAFKPRSSTWRRALQLPLTRSGARAGTVRVLQPPGVAATPLVVVLQADAGAPTCGPNLRLADALLNCYSRVQAPYLGGASTTSRDAEYIPMHARLFDSEDD